jgi:hypothetical protein
MLRVSVYLVHRTLVLFQLKSPVFVTYLGHCYCISHSVSLHFLVLLQTVLRPLPYVRRVENLDVSSTLYITRIYHPSGIIRP